ncbi:uncharacterized protein LOC100120239 isoform X1 [Nasonia vitripennis]|uniref:Uncharacterized protein n=2 Tax=Nasonia vitripennis TaxID=7425 RepID=A0A7M7LUD2_NASVI|nr:uncharacterized protein LOC100120239 isoform X1 [Nasonia vitripennis]
MGKPVVSGATSWQFTTGGNSNSEEPRRSQRNKDLEEIRRNALAAKRKLRGRPIKQRNRSKLEKTLGQFASKRRDIEEAVQFPNPILLSSSRNEEDQSQGNDSHLFSFKKNPQNQDSTTENTKIIGDKILQKPLNLKGFFRAGIKGKQLTRPLTSTERFKQAVLNNDALQIFQSGNFLRPKPSTPVEDLDPAIKMEISKVLKEFTDSSDTDDPVSVENLEPSPVFKRLRKKTTAVKSDSNEVLKNITSPNNEFVFTNKHITKEDKCKRRLFEEENSVVNNGNPKYNNNSQYEDNDAIRFSQRKSTPENVIFFSEYVPAKNVDNTIKKNNHNISPTDPKLIKFYIQTCKMIAKNEFKDVFGNILEEPFKNAKAVLKATYASTLKNHFNQQKNVKDKERSESVDRLTESSTSEIMVEPDSAVFRTLKKNKNLQIHSTQSLKCELDNNSNASFNNNDAEKDILDVGTVPNHHLLKRKYAASSKSGHSDIEVPSSVKVNVDLDSERMTNKMDLVHPDRQELTARYLNDVDLNSQQEIKLCSSDNQRDFDRGFRLHYEKEKLHIGDNNVKKTYFVSKSTKHIPSILRKSRPTVDCVSDEKVLLSIEKGPEHKEISKKALMRDNSGHNVISERTPNCSNLTSNQALEAPKCKYVYMNAKYNQPPRISAPMQVRRLQRNPSSQKMHLFPAPHEARRSFTLSQSFELSPIKKQVSFSDDLNDFQIFQLSQGSSSEIQERTNRLTLHSSQNCSQDSVDQMFTAPDIHCSSRKDLCYSNCVPCNPQNAVHNRGPTLQACDAPFNSNGNCHSQSVIACKDYQLQSVENRAIQGADVHNCCAMNECQMYKSHGPQRSQQHQESLMACMQKQSSRQPVKFIAIEGNRMPQRRPIYGVEDTNICSHTHKPSASSQQYSQVINPGYERAAPEYARYAVSSIPCHSREAVKYDNVQREPSFTGNEFSGPGRNIVNFIPNSMSDQNFVSQQNIPIHRDVHNQRYVAPVQVQIPSPVYTHQVAYQQHNHRSNNEVYKVNDIYLQQVNHNAHQKRP